MAVAFCGFLRHTILTKDQARTDGDVWDVLFRAEERDILIELSVRWTAIDIHAPDDGGEWRRNIALVASVALGNDKRRQQSSQSINEAIVSKPIKFTFLVEGCRGRDMPPNEPTVITTAFPNGSDFIRRHAWPTASTQR